MKVLITGAGGYIGTRLMHKLAESGHNIYALVRSARRLKIPAHLTNITPIEGDLLNPESLQNIPQDIDAAYFLVHSMGHAPKGFASLEETCAQNFCAAIEKTNAKQIIYLSGLGSDKAQSEHMKSRFHVEQILKNSSIPLTTLRAGIIIGSGSISFEIIRDLVEKLPLMVAPKWVNSKCQPIAIRDILYYLENVLGNAKCQDKTFDIGGPDILQYKDMLLQFAKCRSLKRHIITVPVLTPHLSSLWLFFITKANFSTTQALVNSLKYDAISNENSIHTILPHDCLSYEQAIQNAFEKIEQNAVLSSWKDAISGSRLKPHLTAYIEVPEHGCYQDKQTLAITHAREDAIEKLWSIGGKNGWFVMNWAWKLRGLIDRCVGGVGLRRGRTHPTELSPGDALDFWRVVAADKQKGYLLLYAEMRLPGEAWLEWKISENEIHQTATFRPRGLLGRLYWYAMLPFHKPIFTGLIKSLLSSNQ